MRLLLLEGNPDDATLAREALQEIEESRRWRRWVRHLEVVHLECLDEALAVLAAERFDAALVATLLPDATGLGALFALRLQAPDLPVILLVPDGEEALALSAVREGAEDCLPKSELDCALLARALRYAIERRRRLTALGSAALLDQETGLLSGAGFAWMAERGHALARRIRLPVSVLSIPLSGRAPAELAALLRRHLSEADAIARIEPLRFAALLLGQGKNEAAAALAALRLEAEFTAFEPDAAWSVEDLLCRAHGALCENGPSPHARLASA